MSSNPSVAVFLEFDNKPTEWDSFIDALNNEDAAGPLISAFMIAYFSCERPFPLKDEHAAWYNSNADTIKQLIADNYPDGNYIHVTVEWNDVDAEKYPELAEPWEFKLNEGIWYTGK
jgi:hypothetical protein